MLGFWVSVRLLLLSLVCYAPAWAQSLAQSQTTPQTGTTLRVYTRLVQLDVSVTDAKGAPVHGLTRASFHVFDNKRPQSISTFEEHIPDPRAWSSSEPADGSVHSNDFMVHPPPTSNVLLIDTNTVEIGEQIYLYDQLKRFIQTLPSNEPVAICHHWGDYTLLLQDFTADHDLLLAALRKAIPRLQVPGHETYSDLDTLKQIETYFGEIPGRKNVLWFAGGSNLVLFRDPSGAEMQYDHDFRPVYDRLEADRIALYPIDARGLFYTGVVPRHALDMRLLDQQSLMKGMAIATGGRAFYSNNGLRQIASQIVADDGSYYTLTYSPDDVHLNSKWHRVKVAVDEPSFQLSYRQGYFDDGLSSAASPKRGSRELLRKNGTTELVPDTRNEAIIFKAQALPAKDSPPAMIGQLPNPPERGPKRGEITYTIHYVVPLKDFRQVNTEKGKIKVGAALLAFDQYGDKIGSLSQTLSLSFNAADLRSEGSEITFDQSVNLRKGENYLYLVIWDPESRRVGSLEFPLDTLQSTQK